MVGKMILSLYTKTIGLVSNVAAKDISSQSTAETNDTLSNRLFGLDAQLLMDAAIVALAVFVLFLALSYLLFNPARELLKKRQEKINSELKFSEKEKEEAMALKSDYEAKLKNASSEVDVILSEGRKKALKRENEIVDEAKVEAARVLDRAKKEIELEKSKIQDEVKQEMVSLATAMASKVLAESMDESKQAQLVEEALNEIGDQTWQK